MYIKKLKNEMTVSVKDPKSSPCLNLTWLCSKVWNSNMDHGMTKKGPNGWSLLTFCWKAATSSFLSFLILHHPFLVAGFVYPAQSGRSQMGYEVLNSQDNSSVATLFLIKTSLQTHRWIQAVPAALGRISSGIYRQRYRFLAQKTATFHP